MNTFEFSIKQLLVNLFAPSCAMCYKESKITAVTIFLAPYLKQTTRSNLVIKTVRYTNILVNHTVESVENINCSHNFL